MVMGVAQLERLFRLTASLDVDEDDLKRLTDFVKHKLHDLLLMGEVAARANGRDVIQVYDLPITKGPARVDAALPHPGRDPGAVPHPGKAGRAPRP
ncbi:MAG: hypothetical protein KatS3mg131_2617 [Candidatus Tectimicrobiota bacterium]|nr:MAG: hypothetical protein KatS3mg131_2617 [Candidatus Tectomicrobia bacterium]